MPAKPPLFSVDAVAESGPMASDPHSAWPWSAGLGAIYILFCWLAWDRLLIPDEIWGLTNAERSWTAQLGSIRSDLVHPPLIYLLERLWIGLFGLSDFTAKILPVLINLLAIGLFPVLAIRVTKSWRIASILFLTVYLHVYGTPNLVRMYGLVLLLTIASIWAWDAWRQEPTTRRLLTWGMIMALAVMTHYFGALLLATYVLLTIGLGPRPKAFALVSFVPGMIFCAWIAYVLPVYAAQGLKPNLGWVQPSLFLAVTAVPFHFLTTIPSGANPFHADWWATLPARPLLITAAILVHFALFSLALWRLISIRAWSSWLVPLLALVFGPALMLAGVSRLVGPAFDSRFLVGSLPAYWLLIALLSDLGRAPARLLLRAVFMPTAIVAVILPLAHDLAESPLRNAIAHIVLEHKPGDVALGDKLVGLQPHWELRRAGLSLPWALVPAHRHNPWFAVPTSVPGRAWVFCKGECDGAIRSLLQNHQATKRYGTYLTLFERR